MSLTALFMALSVVLLYIGSLFPTFSPSFGMLASLFTVAAVVESGVSYGAMCYVGAAVLGLLLVPDKSSILMYVTFMGYYPVIKSLIERLNKMALEWVIKLIFMNIVLTIDLLLSRFVFVADMNETVFDIIPVGYALMNVVFVMYDYAITAVAKVYVEKISKHRNGR